VSYSGIAAVLVSLSVAAYLHPWMGHRFRQAGLVRKNYRGKYVTPSLGPVLLFAYISAAAVLATGQEISGLGEVTMAMLGMGFVGLIDDLFEENVRGYGGHLREWTEGKMTSGMLKALWGIFLGLLLIPRLVTSPVALMVGLTAFLFWSNGLNQLDRRPGRALKGFWVIWVFLMFLSETWEEAVILLPLAAALLVLLPADLSEKTMLGDAGANALGAAVGVYAVKVLPLNLLFYWLTVGLLLNLLGERYSLSRLVEKNALLSFFDNLGRDRP